MHISIQDGSNYFRGLLLLISKDRRIAGTERELLLRIGRALGFEREFCETAILEVLENSYLPPDPPRFSSPGLAEKFVRDGLAIAGADHQLHEEEKAWLRAAAEANGLSTDWFVAEVAGSADRTPVPLATLQVEGLRMR